MGLPLYNSGGWGEESILFLVSNWTQEITENSLVECLSRLFTLLWKLIWMKSLYCSPVIFRMDPKWKLRRSLPIISKSVGLFLQLRKHGKEKWTCQFQLVTFPLRKRAQLHSQQGFYWEHIGCLYYKDWLIHHCYKSFSRVNKAIPKKIFF